MSISTILTDTLKKENIHFLAIVLCIFMQMLTVNEAYRVFAYINILAVLTGLFYSIRAGSCRQEYGWVKYLLFFILGIYIIHFLAVQGIEFIKELRHLLIAAFLVIGIYMLDGKDDGYVRKYGFRLTLAIVFLYTVMQVVALMVFDKPYGTTKNPHYLALYSSVSLIVAIYCFTKVTHYIPRMLLVICMLLLGGILINTGSRPTWLGLLVAVVLISLFLTRRQRLFSYAAVVAILTALTVTDAGNFATRASNLLDNLGTEERVTIWQDTWRMQKDSKGIQWLVGHGVESFEESFESYSTYPVSGRGFNSPHNYILELLYISGVLGLSLIIVFFWKLYQFLINAVRRENEYSPIYMTLLAALTSSIILTSITLPFFNTNSMNIIAIVIGVMLFLRKQEMLSNDK